MKPPSDEKLQLAHPRPRQMGQSTVIVPQSGERLSISPPYLFPRTSLRSARSGNSSSPHHSLQLPLCRRHRPLWSLGRMRRTAAISFWRRWVGLVALVWGPVGKAVSIRSWFNNLRLALGLAPAKGRIPRNGNRRILVNALWTWLVSWSFAGHVLTDRPKRGIMLDD